MVRLPWLPSIDLCCARSTFQSDDLGRTWTVFYVYPFSTGLTSASQVTHRDWMLLLLIWTITSITHPIVTKGVLQEEQQG